MKYLLSFFLVLITSAVFSQTDEFVKPDFDKIEKKVTDKNSPYYFKTLFERFSHADSTMTMEEKQHLYFGYSFQDDYSPYGSSEGYKELNELLQKPDLNKPDLEKLLKITGEIQKDEPFGIRLMEYRMYAYKQLDMPEKAAAEKTRAEIIIDAIMSTGDGTTPEKCFYVVNTKNEYEILDILGFEFGGEQRLTVNTQDYLAVAENPYSIEGLYFDVTRLFASFRKE